ncbi:hypothetical protein [Myroides sp. WP-1]|uniref:hypothetical protein n=1 Tax=Myroides sp. WP-1 TaxID=2759944 RepID=UPI0015FDE50C|nr:hypothetical protein [Myroides sp. WP-1]
MKIIAVVLFLLSFGFSFGQYYPPIVNVEGQPAIEYNQKIICGFDNRLCLQIIDPIFFPVPPPTPSEPAYQIAKDEVIVVLHTEKGEKHFATKRGTSTFLKDENAVEFDFLRPLSK